VHFSGIYSLQRCFRNCLDASPTYPARCSTNFYAYLAYIFMDVERSTSGPILGCYPPKNRCALVCHFSHTCKSELNI